MMKKYKVVFILLNLVALLVYFNFNVIKKEEVLNNGQLVLLELAPVDPRSLMQGDYMALRYAIAENIGADELPKRGYCILKLDSHNRARRIRFQKDARPLYEGEYLIKYTAPNPTTINIGAESYFFQEGEGTKLEKAKYGGVKIDTQGNSILIGLYDENLNLIK